MRKQKETPHTQENFDKKEILNEEVEQTNLISREIQEDSQPSLKDTLPFPCDATFRRKSV